MSRMHGFEAPHIRKLSHLFGDIGEYFLYDSLSDDHWFDDDIDLAHLRLEKVKQFYRELGSIEGYHFDRDHSLELLENIEIRYAHDFFDPRKKVPAIFLRDDGYLSGYARWFHGKGMSLKNLSYTGPQIFLEAENREGIWHLDDGIGSYATLFRHDMDGIDRFGEGIPSGVTSGFGFTRYLMSKGKSIDEIVEAIPPSHLFLAYMEQIFPANNIIRALLLNIPCIDCYTERGSSMTGTLLWTSSISGRSDPLGLYLPIEGTGASICSRSRMLSTRFDSGVVRLFLRGATG